MERFIETLMEWGLLPDPVAILSGIAGALREANLYEFFRWVGFFMMIGLVGIRMISATAQLRGEAFLSLFWRVLLVGALLQAMPSIQAALINTYAGGLAAGLEVGGKLMDASIRMAGVPTGMITGGALVTAGGVAYSLTVRSTHAARATATNLTNRLTGSAIEGANNQAKNFSLIVDYLNAFAILVLFLFIVETAILVTTGVVVLVGVMLFPIAVPFLVFNGPGVVGQHLQPYYRAFVGSYLVAILVPIIFSMAAVVSVGLPSQEFAIRWQEHWENIQKATSFELGRVVREVGALLWTVIRTAVQVLIGVFLAWIIVNKAVEIVMNFTGGIAGIVKSYAEGMIQARTLGKALRMSGFGPGTGGGPVGTVGRVMGTIGGAAAVGARVAASTARSIMRDLRDARLSPASPPEAGGGGKGGEYDPFSLWDRIKTRWQGRGKGDG